jgi:hypothetical protein
MTTPTATTKIVIVSGQEFSVPADTDNEAIRKQLAGMGFADVASATIQTGKRTVEGQDVTTIEFVKKAGTKGLGGAELVALLSTLPPATLPPVRHYGPTAPQAALLSELADAALTFDQALTLGDELERALDTCHEGPPSPSMKGATLCRTLDQLVAVASAAPVAW